MNPNTAVVAAIEQLTEALGNPHIDLATDVAVLGDDARAAVNSYLGLTITAATGPVPVKATVPPEPWAATARASLRLTLTAPDVVSKSSPPVTLTLYAADAGAFAAFGPEVAYLLRIPSTSIGIDDSLPGPGRESADAVTFSELSVINQAIGILIDRGHEPHRAHDTLTRCAAAAGITLVAAATVILAAAQD